MVCANAMMIMGVGQTGHPPRIRQSWYPQFFDWHEYFCLVYIVFNEFTFRTVAQNKSYVTSRSKKNFQLREISKLWRLPS